MISAGPRRSRTGALRSRKISLLANFLLWHTTKKSSFDEANSTSNQFYFAWTNFPAVFVQYVNNSISKTAFKSSFSITNWKAWLHKFRPLVVTFRKYLKNKTYTTQYDVQFLHIICDIWPISYRLYDMGFSGKDLSLIYPCYRPPIFAFDYITDINEISHRVSSLVSKSSIA